jgi:hypothetical protein
MSQCGFEVFVSALQRTLALVNNLLRQTCEDLFERCHELRALWSQNQVVDPALDVSQTGLVIVALVA